MPIKEYFGVQKLHDNLHKLLFLVSATNLFFNKQN